MFGPFCLPGPTSTLTNRRLYCKRFFARPVNLWPVFSPLATFGVWPRTFPARASDPWTLPAHARAATRSTTRCGGSEACYPAAEARTAWLPIFFCPRGLRYTLYKKREREVFHGVSFAEVTRRTFPSPLSRPQPTAARCSPPQPAVACRSLPQLAVRRARPTCRNTVVDLRELVGRPHWISGSAHSRPPHL